MSLLVLHLRWNDVDPERGALLSGLLPEGDDRPSHCLSRRHVRRPRTLMVYEVWDDGAAAEEELARVRAVLGAGPGEPQRVVFSMPDLYAVGFPARRPAPAAAAPIPTPRSPADTPVPAAPVG
ncbi:hypothetical protein GCM10027451_43730 [Geodermatophilus aquaeductus]|uniref:Antibiotic biosynthesis monooxygenase n=1 Tax=Geodermatophilus aquaeductus TaxID=1564161 RepID=A0A521FP65_9ACTN|nr:hypothetical protein [Geodermatophilus aquaeductus]SMO97997.1 hypothetical protein SAMN06273567_11252 [Geodermatophilus aquaeductus]